MEAKETELQARDLWAATMFGLSLLYLALLASIMVLWIDVPRVAEVIEDDPTTEVQDFAISDEELAIEEAAFRWGNCCGIALLVLWPVFWAEQLVFYFRSRSMADFMLDSKFWLAICLFPPLRMCAQDRGNGNQIWLPGNGWQDVNSSLRRGLERKFSLPMLSIALLILPVLGLQFLFKDRMIEFPLLRFALHVSTGVIWFAFATEFIVMVSVADKKFKYCKKHWLDLLIILLPLVSFLRTLQVLRVGKLAKIGRLGQLSKFARVYRLRGVLMRTFRALLILEVAQRFLFRTKPEKRLASLRDQLEEKLEEVEMLQKRITQLESQLENESVAD